jgi:hypothetical protein
MAMGDFFIACLPQSLMLVQNGKAVASSQSLWYLYMMYTWNIYAFNDAYKAFLKAD